MTLDPRTLPQNLELLERIEKATLRMVAQAIYDFRGEAREFFVHETDMVSDIGEDITREALDRMGTSTIPARLYGKIDYKRARYVFLPEFAARQAMFVDSKAEKSEGAGTLTIQTAQTSMRIRQARAGALIDERGTLPRILSAQGTDYLTTTIFVKYDYATAPDGSGNALESASVSCLPNGMLQSIYNPDAERSIWLAGRNAPSRGEAFRVRVSLPRLKRAASWRVQRIPVGDDALFAWDE